ncbi:unnamed protein product [Brassica oleracea var. botrytis]
MGLLTSLVPWNSQAKMLAKNKINLNEISYNSAMGLIKQVTDMGVLLTEVFDYPFNGNRTIILREICIFVRLRTLNCICRFIWIPW